ncbi:DUF6653 family protein [Salinarimonas ramus]|uniref:Transmembrane protein n=1 Tax=Salinarimonas ramus TaxID=690164 RepID=A0A917QCI2_9HYPH|nr:DUF6653 family protein [Salinarimonas ramus]GGK43873.1 hypothetical protein GCM10011322_33660 [Salinarimonas ramus]
MDLFRASERLMTMDEAAWERHAHPISVYSRMILGLPLVVLAIWSRAWIGWWALAVLALVAFLVWVNPRLTPRPRSTDNWASKATFGERVLLARRDVPVPAHHAVMAHRLTAVSAAGIPFLAYGLWALDPWPTLLGGVLVYAGKLWFLDRMVWLYEDMRAVEPRYAAWLR